MEIVSKRWVSGVQLKAGFLAKGIVLKHSMLRLQGWRMRHRGRSFQFFVARLVNPVTLSFADFQPQNLIFTRKSGRKLKANLSKKYIFSIFLPAAPLTLVWNSFANNIFLLYVCDMMLDLLCIQQCQKRFIFTCVYQLCFLAFTKFVSLRRLGYTIPPCNYFSI